MVSKLTDVPPKTLARGSSCTPFASPGCGVVICSQSNCGSPTIEPNRPETRYDHEHTWPLARITPYQEY